MQMRRPLRASSVGNSTVQASFQQNQETKHSFQHAKQAKPAQQAQQAQQLSDPAS